MSHSPEPWKTQFCTDGPVQILDAEDQPVVGFETDFFGMSYPVVCSTVDLERITICVNALAGVPDESIPKSKMSPCPTCGATK